jgi:hypothetical protein
LTSQIRGGLATVLSCPEHQIFITCCPATNLRRQAKSLRSQKRPPSLSDIFVLRSASLDDPPDAHSIECTLCNHMARIAPPFLALWLSGLLKYSLKPSGRDPQKVKTFDIRCGLRYEGEQLHQPRGMGVWRITWFRCLHKVKERSCVVRLG